MRRRPILLVFFTLTSPLARAAESFGDDGYYLGDPHAHTGVSGDGGSTDLGDCDVSCGDFVTVLDVARDNGLDWVALTDHVNGRQAASSEDYAMLTELVVDGNDPATGFVTVPAAEVWFTLASGGDLGHKTLLLFGGDAALAGLDLADVQPAGSSTQVVDACEDIWSWMDGLTDRYGPAMLIPHHPALPLPMATDWSCHSALWEPSVEAYSAHGNSFAASATYDPAWSGPSASGTVEVALDPGGYAFQMGFMGGTDSHDSRPGSTCDQDLEMTNHPYGGGLTVAVIPSGVAFDRMSLHDAIVARHTYATTGPMVPLRVIWESGGAKLGALGDGVGLPAGQPLDVSVQVPSSSAGAVKGVTLVGPSGALFTLAGNGAGTWTTSIEPFELPEYLYAAVQLDGVLLYGSSTACLDGGGDADEWLWASPSWIEAAPGDLDRDGLTWLEGDCDDGDAGIAPMVPEVWYDGVDQNCDGNDTDQDEDGAEAEIVGGMDCDDTDPSVFIGAVEVWYDGVDEDCTGDSDDDQDEDGWAAAEMAGPDCDDTDPAIAPDVPERWYDGVDQDCDGNDADRDGDGSPYPVDCDDTDPAVMPGTDGLDEDCRAVTTATILGEGLQVSVESGGWSCASAGTPWSVGWLAGLLATWRRRRAAAARPGSGPG